MAKRHVGRVSSAPAEASAGANLSVYIGPTIWSVIQQGTIYHGTPEYVLENDPALKIALKRVPSIAGCVVSADGLTDARKAAQTKGTEQYKNYKAVRDAVRGPQKKQKPAGTVIRRK